MICLNKGLAVLFAFNVTMAQSRNMCAAQSELAMLRAEVRALADNLKDAENRAGLQVSLVSMPAYRSPDTDLLC